MNGQNLFDLTVILIISIHHRWPPLQPYTPNQMDTLSLRVRLQTLSDLVAYQTGFKITTTLVEVYCIFIGFDLIYYNCLLVLCKESQV